MACGGRANSSSSCTLPGGQARPFLSRRGSLQLRPAVFKRRRLEGPRARSDHLARAAPTSALFSWAKSSCTRPTWAEAGFFGAPRWICSAIAGPVECTCLCRSFRTSFVVGLGLAPGKCSGGPVFHGRSFCSPRNCFFRLFLSCLTSLGLRIAALLRLGWRRFGQLQLFSSVLGEITVFRFRFSFLKSFGSTCSSLLPLRPGCYRPIIAFKLYFSVYPPFASLFTLTEKSYHQLCHLF